MTDLHERLESALGPAFAIERELGGGGMSRVFLVADAALGREVVVKVLPPDLGGKVNVERFKREVLIAARLQHPCIVPVLTAGTMDGVPYYTMPYVMGETLRDRLARGTPSLSQTLKILRDVAAALAFAEERGVVHRDLKPENVLLSSGYALVTDFGVAKAVSSGLSDDLHLTQLGMTVGTPAYMAPEQAAGEPDVGPMADVYALGIVAYEMLTGTRPFAARNAQEMLVAHLTTPPMPIDSRRQDLPDALAALVMRCLAKKPAERPAPTELVESLDAISSTIGAVTPSGSPPFTPVAGAAARTAGTAGTLPSLAVLPFKNLSNDAENEYFVDGMTEEILNALARLRTVHVAARTSSFAFKGKAVDLRTVGEQLGVRHVLEGSVRRSGKRLRITVQLIDVSTGFQLWSERYDRELADVFEIQEEIAEAIVNTLKVTLLGTPGAPLAGRHTDNLEAYELYLRGRYFWNQAGTGIERALELFEQALALDPEFALAHAGVADVFIAAGIFEVMPPREAFPLARGAAERAQSLDNTLSEAYGALGAIALFHDWDLGAACEALEHAIALSPINVYAHTWLAIYHIFRGDFDAALGWAKRAIQVDPLAAPPLYGELFAYYAAGRHEDTIECAGRVLQLNPAYAEAYRTMGMSFLALGKNDQALDALRNAVTIGNHSAWLEANLGVAYASLGQRDEARRILAELEERSKKEWISPTTLAALHTALGEHAEAISALEHAYELRDGWMMSLTIEPGWRALRGDPRFEALVSRVGIGASKSEMVSAVAR